MSSRIVTSRAFGPKVPARMPKGTPRRLNPNAFILLRRTPARHTSGLAPNERLPVTWLQHPPIKINA